MKFLLDAKFPKHINDLSDYFNDVKIIESSEDLSLFGSIIPEVKKTKKGADVFGAFKNFT